MMHAKLKLLTSRTLLSLKMMLAKPPSPILITLQSLKMMVARLILLLSKPELMLKLLPETLRTRPSVRESARRSPTAKPLFLTCNRSDSQNDERLGVYFNAYRTKAYDGGGEENLTFQGTYCNVGG